MKKLIAAFTLTLLGTSLISSLTLADGMMMPLKVNWEKLREHSLINEPAQKAVVYFNKGQEQLIISPSYEGSATDFAWVIPVPARPKVEILKGAIFHELAKLTMPKPKSMDKASTTLSAPAPGAVTILERKTVGAYDVSVLSATDGKALMKWLSSNKYHLPQNAVAPIGGYVKDGWTFVACRIKMPANAAGLRTGTLAPIKLTFSTKQPVYPMRLSSANPKPFQVLVYLIVPTSAIGGKTQTIRLLSGPSAQSRNETRWCAVLWKGQKDYPTLAKLGKQEMQIYRTGRHITPQECRSDYVWSLPNRQASH